MAALFAFGLWGLQGPATQALMSRRVSETEQGALQGALASLISLSDGIGPFVFGGLYALTAGHDGAGEGAAFLAASALLAATLAFTAWLLRRPEQRDVGRN